MKVLLSIATVFALSAASAFAGDGQISNKSLANLGLGGMKVMSDADGMSIRGSLASVFGIEIATAGHFTTAANGYASTGVLFSYGTAKSTATSGSHTAFATGSAFSIAY